MNSDELTERNYTLSQMTSFPSFAWYASAWDTLADDAEVVGRVHLAASCRDRAKHYRSASETGQTVIRFLQGGQVRLVETDALPPSRAAGEQAGNVESNPPRGIVSALGNNDNAERRQA